MMGWYDGMGWGGWIVMTLVMLAFWALVILGVVAVFRGVGRNSGSVEQRARHDPMEILEERFARGEIDADEYEARARVLREARPDVGHRSH